MLGKFTARPAELVSTEPTSHVVAATGFFNTTFAARALADFVLILRDPL